ncbi:lysozyme [Methylorubrum rhodinum]|uniref:Lysozyme n=1 Tax=Methylorubrum rhodinum TaxID=29428 RepID=A0A840ZDP0_9HYPH|nr:lysozyme [Methylorubrum rhodinum]MBB5756022.1 lysozyme [Methylorubrum rhodinum]
MDLSPIGRAVLIDREGRRLEAYRDSVGIWTIGVGHTAAAGPPLPRAGLRLTAAECDAIFARDVARFVRTVAQALPEPLPQHAFDALVSLAFNIGPAAFLRSTVLRRLRAGDREGAADAMLMWNRPAVLIPRRQAEFDQFRTSYETALPRARRGDPQPVAAPVVPPPVRPAAPAETPPAAMPTPGWLARLRAWLGAGR